MDFSISALHDLEDQIQTAFNSVTDQTGKCKNILDLDKAMFLKPNKEVLANLLIKVTSVLHKSKTVLRAAAARFDELSSDQAVNQKRLIQMQDELLLTKSEQVEAVHATVKTEIKSFSDVVKQTCSERITPKKLQIAVKTAVEKEDRSKSLMLFGLDEDEDEEIDELIEKVLGDFCTFLYKNGMDTAHKTVTAGYWPK